MNFRELPGLFLVSRVPCPVYPLESEHNVTGGPVLGTAQDRRGRPFRPGLPIPYVLQPTTQTVDEAQVRRQRRNSSGRGVVLHLTTAHPPGGHPPATTSYTTTLPLLDVCRAPSGPRLLHFHLSRRHVKTFHMGLEPIIPGFQGRKEMHRSPVRYPLRQWNPWPDMSITRHRMYMYDNYYYLQLIFLQN